jgi:hypothetical protein
MSTKQKSEHYTKVSDGSCLVSDVDIKLIREHIAHSAAAMRETIELERTFGNRAPILRELEAYAREADALLMRLQ